MDRAGQFILEYLNLYAESTNHSAVFFFLNKLENSSYDL